MTTLVAAIGTVLGALAGVILGSYLQARARKEEWLRQDHLRWLEGRRDCYSSFIEEMDAARACFTLNDDDRSAHIAERMLSLRHKLAGIKLISGSEEVVRTASQFVELFEETAIAWKDLLVLKPADHPDKRDSLRAHALEILTAWMEGISTLNKMPQDFTSAVRIELGLSKLDQYSTKHSAERTRKYAELKLGEMRDNIMEALKG